MALRALRCVITSALVALVAAAAPARALAQEPPAEQPDPGQMAEPGAPIEVVPIEYFPEGMLVEVTFPDTPSGFKEETLLYVPIAALSQGPRPALVVFHQFGKTHFDLTQNTTFLAECRARGWFCVAPLGATKKNFASLESQANVELVLGCTQSIFGPWLDRRRIYGVGFSMGAGDLSTYAARHLDPWKPIFAGVCMHTGNHDKTYVWQTEPGTREVLEFWFGGTPSEEPFAYRQASTVAIAFPSGMLMAGDHQARNLAHTANYSYYAFQDPFTALKTATVRLYQYLSNFAVVNAGGVNTSDLSALPTAHTWASLDATATCDWLATQQLTLPSSGRLVADRKAQYWWFGLTPQAAEQFAVLDFTLDRAARSVSITGTTALASAELPYHLVGFAAGPLTVTTSSADGSADQFVLTGLLAAPAAVTLQGQPAVAGTDYTYDAGSGRLVLLASGLAQVWTVDV